MGRSTIGMAGKVQLQVIRAEPPSEEKPKTIRQRVGERLKSIRRKQ
jgi:hypothetical protein